MRSRVAAPLLAGPTVWVFSLVATGCGNVGLGTDVGASGGTAGSAGTSTPSTASTATGSVGASGGIACGTDPQTGVTLCEQMTACPGVVVEQGAFPGCGFRPRSAGVLDLECLCNGEALCPIGSPTTCADASQLLDQQGSALSVCEALDQGGCLLVGGVDAGAAASACDRACESECQNDPGCVTLCGC